MAQAVPHGEVTFRYTSSDEGDVVTTLADAQPEDVARGLPVRAFGSHAGIGHYPGWWWSATVGSHVGYESLLERDRLMLADFDRDVAAIASQPFGLSGRDVDVIRRHVPDYLLLGPSGTTVVDVKAAEQVDRPEVAAVLSWTGRVIAARAWRYEVWTGASDVLLSNVHFLAQGRRRALVEPSALKALEQSGGEGTSLGAAVANARGCRPADLRSALLVLLWEQVWRIDLNSPLCADTLIDEVRSPE